MVSISSKSKVFDFPGGPKPLIRGLPIIEESEILGIRLI